MTNLPDASATFDHIAHGLFDLIIPALIGMIMAWVNKQRGGQVLERLIKRAAGLGYAEMVARNLTGSAGINTAVADATGYVLRHAKGGDRPDIAEAVRGELGALIAGRRQEPMP